MLRLETMLRSCATAVLLATAWVGLEWLFFVTKPSFLGAAPFSSRFASLWVASAAVALPTLCVHLACLGLAWGLSFVASPFAKKVQSALLGFVPALIVWGTALLLVDNFTYTVIGWGIVSTSGIARLLYALVALGGLVWIWRRTSRRPPLPSLRLSAWTMGAWLLFCALSVGSFVLPSSRTDPQLTGLDLREGRPLPNIILFASDGINARRTSAYGYHLPTTPELERHLERGWVFENAFTNAGRTTGSLTSMVTGRYPATTKVLFPPYTLLGGDAYANLPRLLRGLGYRNIQESVRYYGDGPDLNWRQSFDYANDRWLRDEARVPSELGLALQLPGRVLGVMSQRLGDRLLHLSGLRLMRNVHEEVTKGPLVYGTSDEERMERLFRFIDESDGPFFAHVHLMDTHCCTFRPKRPRFSAEPTGDEERDREAAYDDTIREADEHFGALMDFLRERGLLDDTLVVFSSDHPKGWGFEQPVPLVFFFPDQRKVGRTRTTAQLIDVTPTILDYLGQPIPQWMEGDSLLRDDLPKHRPIFSVADVSRERFSSNEQERLSRIKRVGPPTFGMEAFALIHCDRWYSLQLRSGALESGKLGEFRGSCAPESLISESEARQMMSEHLRGRGFSFAEPPSPSPVAAVE